MTAVSKEHGPHRYFWLFVTYEQMNARQYQNIHTSVGAMTLASSGSAEAVTKPCGHASPENRKHSGASQSCAHASFRLAERLMSIASINRPCRYRKVRPGNHRKPAKKKIIKRHVRLVAM